MLSTLHTTSGERVRLGAELGRGGEGAVYEVQGHPDLVAKVYHEAAAPAKAEKLERMAAARTDALSSVAAWPMAALTKQRRGDVHGLLMPRITDHEEVHLLYGPKSRQTEFPRADYRFLVHAAANVARAFGVIHSHGHVVGDVNHSGVLVSKRATVTLIDCDSFQARIGGEVYRCEVGVPEYTPPELQGRPLDEVIRTPEHDAFGLAVMVFHLLFMGRHPYVGQPTDTDYVPLARAIAEHRFAYGSGAPRRRMRPPPHTLPLRAASPAVAALFERAFAPSAVGRPRPTPGEWVAALDRLQHELRGCARTPSHTYWRGLSACPWCGFEQTLGFRYFPPASAQVSRKASGESSFDLDAVWARIERVAAPQPLSDPQDLVAATKQAPSEQARAFRLEQHGLTITLAILGGLPALIGAVEGDWVMGVIISVVFLAGATLLKPRVLYPQKCEAFRQKAAPVRDRIRAIVADHSQEGESFETKKQALREARRKLQELAGARREAISQLRRTSRERQLDRFLSRHRVAKCDVRGVGPGRKQALISYGIEDAADVTPDSVTSVPGFGIKLARRMVAWRRDVERTFKYDPSAAVTPADIALLDAKLDLRRRELQQALLRGPSELESIRRKAANLHHQMEVVVFKNAQALVDVAYLEL